MKDERGQALALALAALAIGTLLITPFLGSVSVNSIASRNHSSSITEQYSSDAGIEWALWKLRGNPTLTTETEYTAEPLEPTPTEINGSPFPTTEIRFVEGARATETITPEWQSGAGWMSYPFEATDSGTVVVIVETDAPIVKIKLHGALGPPGSSPYTAEIDGAGSYTIKVQTLDEEEEPYVGPGIITITYPIASYDIRAQKGDRTITVRATASYLATRVISWQE